MSPEANQRKAAKLMAKTATIVTSFDRSAQRKDILEGDPRSASRQTSSIP